MSILTKQISGKKTERVLGIIFIPLGILAVAYFVFAGASTPSTPLSSDSTQSDYGSSLTECLQKSKDWFADAKATSMSVLADEEKRGFYNSYDKQKEIDSINVSLAQELADYQRECRQHFN